MGAVGKLVKRRSSQTHAIGDLMARRDRLLEQRMVRAGYDAAKTTNKNANHWAEADAGSVQSANTLSTRKTLRERARYEWANNPYCNAMVRIYSYSITGRGPRIHVETDDQNNNKFIEQEIAYWMESIRLARKLRTGLMAKGRDGEDFSLKTNNPKLPTPVKLDLTPIECDRFTNPVAATFANDRSIDGKLVDEFGNAITYRILDSHPGDTLFTDMFGKYTDIPADKVYHLYRHDRPGQQRGIPDITAALPLFSQVRRITLATLDASEAIADVALVMQTDAAPEDADLVLPFDVSEVERGSMVALPAGYKLGQVDAKQPNAQFREFRMELIAEAARVFLMPYLVAAGDARNHSFSGGRLDKEGWDAIKEIERAELEIEKLKPFIQAWWEEAQLISGYIPRPARSIARLPIKVGWDASFSIDPVKTEQAAMLRLKSGRSNLPAELAAIGKDWRESQKAAAESLNITVEKYQELLQASHFEKGIQLFGTNGDAEDTANANDRGSEAT